MSACCTPGGYRHVFSEKSAAGAARRYRARGLDRISRQVADLLIGSGVENATVLEVGGGIGAIQLELLKAGARRAVSVELTPTYEVAAAQLIRDAGMEDRIERRVLDFVTAADLAPADVVVMNRVVCCYPDMPRLVGAAADRTRGILVMTFPRRTWWTRALLTLANLGFSLARREFRIFLHRPDQIRAAAEGRGLRAQTDRSGLLWQTALLSRSSPRG